MPGSTPTPAVRVRAGRHRLACVPCIVLLAAWARAAPDPTVVTLSIVGTTDLHGFIAPRDGRGGLAVFGGYLANLRAARAADGGGVVLVDAGDTYLGGIESDMSEGAVVVDAYNALGYTAAALGNHDLEFGAVDQWPFGVATGDPRGAIKALARQARYPMLAANLVDGVTRAPVAWPNVRPSALVTVAGVRVGLIGVMTYDALSLTLAANVAGLETASLVDTIRREARQLRADGAQVVVVVAHAGGTCSAFDDAADLTSCDHSAEIFEVARRLPAGLVTAIVAGHTHDAVAHTVAGIPIVQAYSWGRAFSRVDLEVGRGDGVVRGARMFAPQEICAWREPATGTCAVAPSSATATVARYEGREVRALDAVAAAMVPALARVAAWRATALGVIAATPIDRGPGDAESPLGNLFAEAISAVAPGVDGAFSYGAGPGGLRADLAAGPLSLGAVYDLFPFDNRVVPVTLRGADLRALLLDHLRRPRWRARALGVAGLQVAFDCQSGRDEVTLRRVGGGSVGDADTLSLVVTDFLAARLAALRRAGVVIGPAPRDVQVRDAALTWLRKRSRVAAGDVTEPFAPRWARSDASIAGCQTPPR